MNKTQASKIVTTISPEQWEALSVLGFTTERNVAVEKLNKCESNLLEAKIGELLVNKGIPIEKKGFEQIRQAIILVLKDSSYKSEITKRLWPDVAEKCSSTDSRVQRNIRHAIKLAYGEERPTPTQFINSMVEEIKRGI